MNVYIVPPRLRPVETCGTDEPVIPWCRRDESAAIAVIAVRTPDKSQCIGKKSHWCRC
jgi:hypothetical protein